MQAVPASDWLEPPAWLQSPSAVYPLQDGVEVHSYPDPSGQGPTLYRVYNPSQTHTANVTLDFSVYPSAQLTPAEFGSCAGLVAAVAVPPGQAQGACYAYPDNAEYLGEVRWVDPTPSEWHIQLEELSPGRFDSHLQPNGGRPSPGDTVSVHYTGKLVNGHIFDSSRRKGKPFQFQVGVGRVIKGWDAAVLQMRTGQRVRLTIQPSWGYGEKGSPPDIPPNSVLVFDVELLGILPGR